MKRLIFAVISGLAIASAPMSSAGLAPAFFVPATGEPVTVVLPPGTYTIRAEGTYEFGPFPMVADAKCHTIGGGWADELEGFVPDPNLELVINEEAVAWTAANGICDTLTHSYSATRRCFADCVLSFQIVDPFTADNRGCIAVFIEPFSLPPAESLRCRVVDLKSDNTLHIGGKASVRLRASAAIGSAEAADLKQESAGRYASALQQVPSGNLLPLLNEILAVQSNPPPVLAAAYGPDGILHTQSSTDGPTTPGCYGIENHSGAFNEPLQVCSQFLP